MKALIDGDIILYRVGYTTDKEEEWIAIARTNDTIRLILEEVSPESYEIFLSDSAGNYRKALYPEYKANRTQPKPVHYDAIKAHLISFWEAKVATGQEADDALGINQTEGSIICSIDKDLYQVPGNHYNFVTKEFRNVSPEEGVRHFYSQLLTGDKVDNVPGIYGIGPKKAEKILAPFYEPEEFYKAVLEAYKLAFSKEHSEEKIESMVLLNGQLLKIRQREEELWNPPKPREEAQLPSTLSTPEVSERSTEPMIPATQ